MNKQQFISLVKETGNIKTDTLAAEAVNAVTEAITKALSNREDITLVGFGTFSTTLLKGKSGKVPGTDKTYTTQDKMIPKFKAGKRLKDRVASGK